MKKKMLFIVLSLVCAFTCAFGLTGCANKTLEAISGTYKAVAYFPDSYRINDDTYNYSINGNVTIGESISFRISKGSELPIGFSDSCYVYDRKIVTKAQSINMPFSIISPNVLYMNALIGYENGSTVTYATDVVLVKQTDASLFEEGQLDGNYTKTIFAGKPSSERVIQSLTISGETVTVNDTTATLVDGKKFTYNIEGETATANAEILESNADGLSVAVTWRYDSDSLNGIYVFRLTRNA